ncbi:sporulation integral membrane protein YlbJ [Clostridium sp. DJ247]|uniref:sporulation integral membrane protein YlbJ n=1 Tax=Clostridium sp. DJ247 TaxID=2726188 RepID=UPI001624819B|nr:sporulation integral membrane protein YlbJ [Clostridium sp. DJ247]MBC2578960.1 sporulation integral membrane protein YlbJ [Clostridium sp. DJ247]
MKLIFYLLIIIIILLLSYLLKNKNITITIVCSLLILQIIAAPKVCIDGAVDGALLFFYKVFPSLFSFLVVSNIILSYDGILIYSKIFGKALCTPVKLPKNCSFVLIVSALCGYPLGAKYACDIYEKRLISVETFERLLNIASNASPLFVLGSVGISMLNSSYIGYILLISNFLSCIIMGVLLPSNNIRIKKVLEENSIYSSVNIGDVLKASIENSIKTCLSIGGFVTLFSVVNNILRSNYAFKVFISSLSSFSHVSKDIIEGFILGMIEMTNGCSLISSINISIVTKIAIVSFLFTFSGLSIISQVYSFTYRYNVSMMKYTFRKVFQGMVCSTISVILYKIPTFNFSIETFASVNQIKHNLNSLFTLTIIILIIPWILFKAKSLFHIS